MTQSIELLDYELESIWHPPLDSEPVRILVVDDEDGMRVSLRELLERQNYAVAVASSGTEALACLQRCPFDLVLLDLVLPDLNGLELTRHIRQIQPDAKIILLSSHGTLESVLDGMHLGIFDYLLKTEHPSLILSRIAEAARHRLEERHTHHVLDKLHTVIHELTNDAQADGQPNTLLQSISAGPFQISLWEQTVRIGERVASLTTTELHVLACLARRAGQVLSYDEIAREGLGHTVSGMRAADLIKPHIYHLRLKLEPDPSNPRYILTVRSVGYLLAVDAGRPDDCLSRRREVGTNPVRRVQVGATSEGRRPGQAEVIPTRSSDMGDDQREYSQAHVHWKEATSQ